MQTVRPRLVFRLLTTPGEIAYTNSATTTCVAASIVFDKGDLAGRRMIASFWVMVDGSG